MEHIKTLKMIKSEPQLILDENGFEGMLSFQYDRDTEKSSNTGFNEVNEGSVELLSFEVIFAGVGIEILHKCTQKQKDFLLSKIDWSVVK